MIFVLGLARSGTTWLGKIFDSHPEVVYRHEPDLVYRNDNIPIICRDEDIPAHLSDARRYLGQLRTQRHPRTVGIRPIFTKSFMSAPAHYARYGLIQAGVVARRLRLPRSVINRLVIPDFAGRDLGKARTTVIKSVHALGRLNLYQAAVPESRTILLIRHPCGQVASSLRGLAAGFFVGGDPLTTSTEILSQAAEREDAQRRGRPGRAALGAMKPIELLAWRWVVMNELALDAARGDGFTRLIRYEDLCARPAEIAKELFAFAGLEWNEQTAAFLSASTSRGGEASYYSVMRNTKDAAERWRQQLSPEEIETVLAITARTEPGRLFIDGGVPERSVPEPQAERA